MCKRLPRLFTLLRAPSGFGTVVRRHILAKSTIGLSLWFLILGCQRGVTMQVELDAFSGRPNPTWTLPAGTSADLLSKISSLSEVSDAATPPDLGFRGFVLRAGDRTIRVYRGRVIVEEHGVKHIYRDTAGIEPELKADARQHGFEAVVGSDVEQR